jgi:hypothetical protein
MPLFQGTGITSLGSSFQAFFCLLSDEQEASYTWALEQYQEVLREYSIPDPLTLITDFDQGLKNAAKNIFPNTQQQICVWHIMKNVVHNIKKKWIGPLEGSRLVNSLLDEAQDTTKLGNPDQDTDDEIEDQLATELLHQIDQVALSGQVHEQQDDLIDLSVPEDPSNRDFSTDPDGILSAWKAVVYAGTEATFKRNWLVLQYEFKDQPSKPASYLFAYLLTYQSRYRQVSTADIYPSTASICNLRSQEATELRPQSYFTF